MVVRGAARYGTPVVVDDASTDATATLARDAGAVVVSLLPGRGYEGAIEAGFVHASKLGADVVVTLDADGQHDPATLPAFLEPLLAGAADLIIGIRPAPARLMEAAFGWYTRLRYGVPDILCGMKGYRMDLYHAHGRFDGSRSVGTELTLAALRRGTRFRLVAVPIREREGTPRFGRAMRANLRILRAMAHGVWNDIVPRKGHEA